MDNNLKSTTIQFNMIKDREALVQVQKKARYQNQIP
jgi:hypothetical protein